MCSRPHELVLTVPAEPTLSDLSCMFSEMGHTASFLGGDSSSWFCSKQFIAFSFFFNHFVKDPIVHPCRSTDTSTAREKFCFILSEKSYDPYDQ